MDQLYVQHKQIVRRNCKKMEMEQATQDITQAFYKIKNIVTVILVLTLGTAIRKIQLMKQMNMNQYKTIYLLLLWKKLELLHRLGCENRVKHKTNLSYLDFVRSLHKRKLTLHLMRCNQQLFLFFSVYNQTYISILKVINHPLDSTRIKNTVGAVDLAVPKITNINQ